MTDTPRPLHLASSTWMRETGIRLGDQAGWTGKVPSFSRVESGTDLAPVDFDEPITREEFIDRARNSSVDRWPDPPYDERPEPPDEFVSRLAEALKSEFGVQFGMGINAPDESWKRASRGIALKMRCEKFSAVVDEDTRLMGVYFNRRVSE